MLLKFTLLLSSIVAFGAASAPVSAEQLYRWESADGTVSFTDDVKRVPEPIAKRPIRSIRTRLPATVATRRRTLPLLRRTRSA